MNYFLFQRSSSECHSYFFIWEGLPLFSGRKQRLMVDSISWNLDSLNNCSVEHLKYTKIPGLVWAMEEVYAATYWFDTCVSAWCAAPLLSVSVEKPHNCKRGVTAHSSVTVFTAGLGLYFWTWIQRGVLTFLGMYLCRTSSKRWSKA